MVCVPSTAPVRAATMLSVVACAAAWRSSCLRHEKVYEFDQ